MFILFKDINLFSEKKKIENNIWLDGIFNFPTAILMGCGTYSKCYSDISVWFYSLKIFLGLKSNARMLTTDSL